MSDNPYKLILFAYCNGKICSFPFFTCNAMMLCFVKSKGLQYCINLKWLFAFSKSKPTGFSKNLLIKNDNNDRLLAHTAPYRCLDFLKISN